ncbi:MAG TPA: hypothetical protein VED40_02195 [Azospirillaceae bacterium]|nr:hypothetical protein [Azospirillaceae bacterium]
MSLAKFGTLPGQLLRATLLALGLAATATLLFPGASDGARPPVVGERVMPG